MVMNSSRATLKPILHGTSAPRRWIENGKEGREMVSMHVCGHGFSLAEISSMVLVKIFEPGIISMCATIHQGLMLGCGRNLRRKSLPQDWLQSTSYPGQHIRRKIRHGTGCRVLAVLVSSRVASSFVSSITLHYISCWCGEELAGSNYAGLTGKGVVEATPMIAAAADMQLGRSQRLRSRTLPSAAQSLPTSLYIGITAQVKVISPQS